MPISLEAALGQSSPLSNMKRTNSSRMAKLALQHPHSDELDTMEDGGSCGLMSPSSRRRNESHDNKQANTAQLIRCRSLGALAVVFITVLFGLFMFFQSSSSQETVAASLSLAGISTSKAISDERASEPHQNQNELHRSMTTEPDVSKLHRGTSEEGVEYIWQLPLSGNNVKGIFFVAHGCKHSATDWFPWDEDQCPTCLGLPEEVAIVRIARERGMLVLAASSKERDKKCWLSGDGKRVATILEKIQKAQHLTSSNLPVIGMGSSSGAEMVGSFLTKATQVDGIISQNKVPNDRWTDVDVPAVFISLPLGDTKTKVKDYVEKQRRGPTRTTELSPLVLNSNFFHERIPDKISPSNSEAMFHKMQQTNLLDEHGVLIKDPRTTRQEWSQLFRPLVENDSFIPDESPVFEVMNVAYGHHQTTRDGVAEALDWILLTHEQQKHKGESH